MYGQKHAQIGPVCKFGPGGDFVSIWPERFAGLYEPLMGEPGRHRLARLREALAGVIGLTTEKTAEMERSGYASDGSRTAYAGVAAGTEGGGRLRGQAMLFADDSRAAGHKSKHRVRAYRRAAKKRAALEFGKQGSLFTADSHCAKTA